MQNFDFTNILSNVEEIKKMKTKLKEEARYKTSKGIQLIEIIPMDSENDEDRSILGLKDALIELVNNSGKTYGDLLRYCDKLIDGDGRHYYTNLLNGITRCETMTLSKFEIWLDFLGLTLFLKEKE